MLNWGGGGGNMWVGMFYNPPPHPPTKKQNQREKLSVESFSLPLRTSPFLFKDVRLVGRLRVRS